MSSGKMTKENRVFGERLKGARELAGYKTAADFAREIGVTPDAYRFYERGQCLPPTVIYVRICTKLGVDPKMMLDGA